MPFSFDLSDEMKAETRVLARRDRALSDALNKKIRQIIASDESTIGHYKNLKHNLSDCKRVHIGNFVLMFKVFRKEKFILFYRFRHHDDAYRR